MRPNDDVFESLYTMTDYYDGPVEGVADFRGRPHFYKRREASQHPEWEDPIYEIRPIDNDTFQLAMEAWNIWLNWEDAYHKKKTDLNTHPALPEDRARYDEIQHGLSTRLACADDESVVVKAEFSQFSENESRYMKVRWTVIERPDR